MTADVFGAYIGWLGRGATRLRSWRCGCGFMAETFDTLSQTLVTRSAQSRL
jgi:hypothetical protein